MALSLVPGIGSITARQLIAHLGSAEAIFKEKPVLLRKIQGIGPLLSNNIGKDNFEAIAENELEFINKYAIKAYNFLDADYPKRLKQCDDAPIVLFQKGGQSLDRAMHISIVGTRKASEYGKYYCQKIISDLKSNGIDPVIISGLAYGIDGAAHRAALENGLETWAVLGHGLDRIYPPQHKNLATTIAEKGSLLTEFTHGSFPARTNFISRNRIIAGLSDLTIVIESAKKGGSLITADIAFGYDREVMAVPGRIGDSKSEGCNYLIKTQKASMYEGFDDMVKLMGWDHKGRMDKGHQLNLFDQLNPEQTELCNWLKAHEDSTIDQIVKLSGLNKQKIPALLLDLELMNLVKPLPGKRFRLL